MEEEKAPESKFSHITENMVTWAEDVIHALVAVLLAVGALIVLSHSAYQLVTELPRDVRKALQHSLDSLLIVFILVELLAALRSVLVERHLVAEPFLLVGMISGIREILLLATFGTETANVRDVSLEIGVLAAMVLGFAVASLLVRRGQREPEE